jgi:hypothetical protein
MARLFNILNTLQELGGFPMLFLGTKRTPIHMFITGPIPTNHYDYAALALGDTGPTSVCGQQLCVSTTMRTPYG